MGSKMSAISIDIRKGDSKLKQLDIPITEQTIEGLLSSLKNAKNDSNEFLTTLVNKEKDMNRRKLEEIETSDDDANETTPSEANKRQKKT